jgi:hypothetical protein
MEKLERYLDQVCRSMGGPRSLRQHLRQELREHLLDLASQHQASGLSEAEALDRALDDFGGPDELKSGLEATYGHRLLPVVIDKAMQWKEKTMRAKWLWATWAHLAVASVILLEVMWITFAAIFLIPKFQRLLQDGLIDGAAMREQGVGWMTSFLSRVSDISGHYTTWLLLLAACVCGIFEWRVRGENKTLIRLSAWGSAAIFLLIVGILIGATMIIPYELTAPAFGHLLRHQVKVVDNSLSALDEAVARKDWEGIREQASVAATGLNFLMEAGPAVRSAFPQLDQSRLQELRAQLKAASASLAEIQRAGRDPKDASRASSEMHKVRELIQPLRQAATP